jgi:hypothetical protein
LAADAGITDRSNAVSPDGAVNATRAQNFPHANARSKAGDVGRGRKPPSRLPNLLVGEDFAAWCKGDKLCTFLWLPPWFLGGEPATATVNLGVSLLCLFADFLAGEPAAKGGSRPLEI